MQGRLRLRNDEGLNLVRLSNAPQSEHNIVQLRPIFGPPLRTQTGPSDSVTYSPNKVRDHAGEFNAPTHRRYGSLDMATFHQNTVLPSIEVPQFTDPPRSSGTTQPQVQDYVARPLTPQPDI